MIKITVSQNKTGAASSSVPGHMKITAKPAKAPALVGGSGLKIVAKPSPTIVGTGQMPTPAKAKTSTSKAIVTIVPPKPQTLPAAKAPATANSAVVPAAKPIANMRDLVDRIAADPKVSAARAGQIRSAVKRICALIGTSPESAPADPAFFADRVARLTPGLAGVAEGTLRNLRSLLQAAFNYVQAIKVPRRSNVGLSGPFADLYRVVERKEVRVRLGRFFRFAQEVDIKPHEIIERHFMRFHELLTESGDPNARMIDRQARIAWNRCVREIEGWPGGEVSIPKYTDHYVLPLGAFPQSFQDDLAAYIDSRRSDYVSDPLAMLSTEELFAGGESEHRRARPMGKASADLTAYQLRQFASVLVIAGVMPIGQITMLKALIVPARVKLGLQHLIDRTRKRTSNRTRTRIHENSQIFGIAMKISLVARHWVGADEATCKQLTLWAYSCRPKHTGLPESARRSIAPLRDASTVARFLDLPQAEFARLRQNEQPSLWDAGVAAAALWIAIAQRVPARISNLVGIDVERHLVHAGTPKNPRCSLIFGSEEVKNGKLIEAPLPKSVVVLIAEYVKRYRHLLTNMPTTALFPDIDGRPKRPNTMSRMVQQLLRRRLGFTVNPHSFRHVAAMLYLSINKGDYASVQLILGHKKLETTIKYYVDLKAEEAFKALDALLEAYLAGKSNPQPS
jgi:integrase